jgi:hypothetical protein
VNGDQLAFLGTEPTARDVREAVLQGRHDGITCPTCDQYAKVYRRNINSGMARSLILLYRQGPGFVHVPTAIGARSREEGKLAYWGLAEEEHVVREDGGRAGWWRITSLGVQFVLGRVSVQKYALVYNGRVLEHDGPPWTIRDALGKRFNYAELMAGWAS